jgi:hypothetical protein
MKRSPQGQSEAARNGASLEADLDRYHLTLVERGWYVHRKWPAGPQRKVGPPDYLLVSPTGHPVLFDAKSTKAPRWPVSLLSAHQYADLSRFTGLAAIYLRLPTGDRWVTMDELGPLWREWWTTKNPVHLTATSGRPAALDWASYVG